MVCPRRAGIPNAHVGEPCSVWLCTDQWLGEFLDKLEASGELDRTLIVFLSDHGETNNVAAIQVEITEKLKAEMFESNQASRRKLERFAQGTSVEIDAELRANLRTLGYLGDEN